MKDIQLLIFPSAVDFGGNATAPYVDSDNV